MFGSDLLWSARQVPADLDVEFNPAHPLSSGLVGCYVPGLGAGWRDWSPFGNHGALGKGLPLVGYANGPAQAFDNATLVTVSGNVQSSTITQIFWVHGPIQGTISGGAQGGEASLQVGSGSSMSFNREGQAGLVSASFTALDARLHQLVASIDGSGTAKLYLDGVLLASNGGQVIGSNQNDAMYLGGAGNGERFQGALDHVKLYNRALTDQEVRQEYLERFAVFRLAMPEYFGIPTAAQAIFRRRLIYS